MCRQCKLKCVCFLATSQLYALFVIGHPNEFGGWSRSGVAKNIACSFERTNKIDNCFNIWPTITLIQMWKKSVIGDIGIQPNFTQKSLKMWINSLLKYIWSILRVVSGIICYCSNQPVSSAERRANISFLSALAKKILHCTVYSLVICTALQYA